MFRKLSTRGRAVVACLIMTVIVFIISSPLTVLMYELIFPPNHIENIQVTEKSGEVELTWSKGDESDLSGYVINFEGQEIKLGKEETTYVFFDLENGAEYDINIVALDESSRRSVSTLFTVSPADSTERFEVNMVSSESEGSRTIIITSILVSAVLFFLTLWVLFFKVDRSTMFTVALFPSMASIPYLIFFLTLLASLNSFNTRLILSLGLILGYVIGCYLLLLTTNILNGSVFNSIPLEQAGKAAQFIFSLVATYLILIYAFGSYQSFVLRLLISLPFIYYFTYSSIWLNKSAIGQQVFMRTITISLIMVITLLVLSVWPIDSVYAILAASVIFYILLNVALEIRKTLNRAVWIEYSVLTLLIIFLLFANGLWGINGSII